MNQFSVMTLRPLISLHIALFCSGAAALMYQLTWGRMLQRVFGVSDLAVATVLTAFFLGLGIGSAVGGRLSARTQRPALLYAILEGCIGVYAVASVWFIPAVHRLYPAFAADASFEVLSATRFVLALALLLPPTLLMGATMPILVHATRNVTSQWSSGATALYVTNTLGAAIGAGATGFFLVPQLGTKLSVNIAAGLSVFAASLVLLAWKKQTEASRTSLRPPQSSSIPPADSRVSPHPTLALWLGGLSGFGSLAGEVVWTRVLRIIVEGTTQAFAAMLFNYLLGIALGSWLAEYASRRRWKATHVFGVSQALLGILASLAMACAAHFPRWIGILQRQPDLTPHHPWIVFVLSGVLLFPLAIALGTSIPLAWRISGVPAEGAARQAGRILAVNTFCGMLGSLAAGFFLIPVLGTETTILLLICIHLVIAVASFRADADTMQQRLLALGVPATIAASVFLVQPSIHIPFLLGARHDPLNAVIRGPGGEWQKSLAFLREGRNTTVSITKHPGLLRLFNDGRPESGFSAQEPGFGSELALLGGLPSVFSRHPHRAMIVGLGAGHTATVLLGGPWEHVDVVELEEAVVDAARFLHRARGKSFPLDNPRTHLTVDDARTRLILATEGSYDAIVSQPSHPWLAGSSALYTREFFREAQHALRKDGVMSLWINLFRMDIPHIQSVVATLLEVFPYVQGFVAEGSSLVLCASQEPIALNRDSLQRFRTTKGLAPFFGPHGMSGFELLASFREFDSRAAHEFAKGAVRIVDDRPSLEFELARIPSSRSVTVEELDHRLKDLPWMSPESFQAFPPQGRVALFLARLERVATRPDAIARVGISIREAPWGSDDRTLLFGAFHEAMGTIKSALKEFDGSRLRIAALRADRLRFLERRYEEALLIGSQRVTLPMSAEFLLRSAFALGTKAALLQAIRSAEQVQVPGDRIWLSLANGYVSNGCDGLLQKWEELEKISETDEHISFLGERCAIEKERWNDAQHFAELRARARRISAVSDTRSGEECMRANHIRGARVYFRRALLANPAHGLAAAGLAKVLAKMGHKAEAERVLKEAARAARGLTESARAIWGAADALGLSLEKDEERIPLGTSPSSAAPSISPSDK